MPSSSVGIPGLSQEQWSSFINLLNNKKIFLQFDSLSGKMMSEQWILDTGCSHHMIGRKNFLRNLSSTPPYRIVLPNGTTSIGVEIGSVSLSPQIFIKCVLYIPHLQCILISLSNCLKKINV